MTSREIKRKYVRSSLGIIWSILNPLLFMIVMSIVFSGFSKNQMSYPAYFVIGYTMWIMFNTATTTSMSTFVDNKTLIEKTKIPRELFVFSRDYTALINHLYSCVALLIVLVLFKITIHLSVIYFFVATLFELLFAIGISLVLATVYVFYRDIKFVYINLMVLMVHMIAIYMPLENYPEIVRGITVNNPLYIYPEIAREGVLNGYIRTDLLVEGILWAIFSFVFGIVTFKANENTIIEKI